MPFLSSALQFFRPSRPLRRQMTVLLLIKAAIILAAVYFVFGPSHRLHVTTQIMQAQLFNTETTPSHEAP